MHPANQCALLFSQEFAPFGKFYIHSYMVVCFLTILLSIFIDINYSGIFVWSQTSQANTTVKLVSDIIIIYIIFTYIWVLFQYLLNPLSYQLKIKLKQYYEFSREQKPEHNDISPESYRLQSCLISIFIMGIVIVITHLFMFGDGDNDTRLGRTLSLGYVLPTFLICIIHLMMYYCFIMSFIIWEQRRYV